MNFLSSTLKQRNFFFFAFLFFIGISIIFPFTVHATNDWLDKAAAWETDLFDSAVNVAKETIDGLILATGQMIISFSFFLMGLGQSLLTNVINSNFIQGAITTDKVVVDGWTAVRDFANMFIVLGFMVIGIATILRIREYEAQKLLPTLIIIALLINFSLLICGLIIDGSNITINYFLAGAISQGGGDITNTIQDAVTKTATGDNLKTALKNSNWSLFGSIIASSCLYAIVSGMLFIMYAALFIFRKAALMCLVILSPLAFVCYVFPVTKPIWSKWWGQFTQWAIVGIPAMFFIYLGSKMAISTFSAKDLDIATDPLSFFVPVAFLYFAYTLTFQISAIGAAGIVGAASGAMGFVAGRSTGAIGSATKRLGDATGLTNAGHAVTGAGSRMLEAVGLRRAGATSAMNANRVENEGKKYNHKAMTNDEILSEMRQRGARGASAFKEATSRKILNQYAGGDVNQLSAATNRARTWGVNTKDAEKQMPNQAGNNPRTMERLTGTINPETVTAANPAGRNYTQAEARNVATREAFSGMKRPDLEDLHHTQVTQADASALIGVNHNTLQNARLNQDQAGAWQNRLPEITAERDRINTLITGSVPGTPAYNQLTRLRDNANHLIALLPNL